MVLKQEVTQKDIDNAMKCAIDLAAAIDILVANERLKKAKRALDLEAIRLQ